MKPNEQVIERLFTSLERGDFQSAGECYCDDSEFRDIAFDLKGKGDITAMWHLVCSKQTTVSFRDINADDRSGSAHWVASYVFSKTGRAVRNEIDSTFFFRGGKILVHHDHCSRWGWARQAFDILPAIALTTFPFNLRWQAAKELKRFKESQAKPLPAGATH
jgi:ketosteroid isomerase-like protein